MTSKPQSIAFKILPFFHILRCHKNPDHCCPKANWLLDALFNFSFQSTTVFSFLHTTTCPGTTWFPERSSARRPIFPIFSSIFRQKYGNPHLARQHSPWANFQCYMDIWVRWKHQEAFSSFSTTTASGMLAHQYYLVRKWTHRTAVGCQFLGVPQEFTTLLFAVPHLGCFFGQS